jgi:peptidyl-dipeptidase Dcp
MMTDGVAVTADNPFFAPWSTPFEIPPFAQIAPEHFRPAFDRALDMHNAEIGMIAGRGDTPSFANTVETMERSGRDLRRVSSVFFNVSGSHTNDALQAIEREMAPRLARHRSAIFMNEALYARFVALFERRGSLSLSEEQGRVLDRYHTIFIRAGAQLDSEGKKRLAAIVERLATLGTQFSQNVLADEKAYTLVLETEEDLAGLPDFLCAAAAREAEERGLAGKHVITLSRSSIEPFLTFSAQRGLREKAFLAWTARGDNGGETDNKAIIAEIVALRAERAKLLGYETFADYKLADTMASTPQAALALLHDVWRPAVARAARERDALQALAAEEGGNFELAAWDWRYYAERLRKREHDLDEAEIKPYLQLDRMIEAAFDTAHRLFGLEFAELVEPPRYHPDVRVWEVKREGRHIGVFIGDYFARPSKRSGAWMSSFRSQDKLAGEIRPIIVNVSNFAKGDPALLCFDDARTLFHEFGHALHGLLSDVAYLLLAGTSVPTDFVELPSQLYEHWLEEPQVLRRFAVHYRTGEPMPEGLIERVLAARTFDQGFATVEYTASALVDMDLHQLRTAENLDIARFEREALARIGMPREIVMRHRPPHFAHIFSGDGYAAGYYSYLWSEVLDADAFAAFREAGDIFDPATAKKLHDFIYAAGNRRPPDEAYRAFRGRMPSIQALLEKRGLSEAPTDARAS